MPCDPSSASCQLERIANQLTGFDVGGVLTSIGASFAGAAIAGLVAWLIFRRETNERYEVRLTSAAEQLMLSLTKYADEYKRFTAETEAQIALTEDKREAEGVPIEPNRASLDVDLDMLIARSAKADRTTAMQIREVAYQLTFIRDGQWVWSEIHALRRIIAAWRSGRKSNSETRESLAVTYERREMKEKNPNLEEAELPQMPEEHKKVPIG